jgi:hypothetical protein
MGSRMEVRESRATEIAQRPDPLRNLSAHHAPTLRLRY